MDAKKLLIVAVGGQGNLLASKILGEAAIAGNVPLHMSEIHGMAQRGGVVESSVLFGDVQSTIISDGETDILVGFEPSETLRAIGKCNKNSIVISSTSPLPPFTVAIGRGVYPDIKSSFDKVAKKCKKLIAFDGIELAHEAGTALSLNMVMLGALAQTGTIPLSAELIKETIRTKTKKAFTEMNIKAFELGYEAAAKAA